MAQANTLTQPSSPSPVSPGAFTVPHHIAELDGLRGLAALMVVFHHMAKEFRLVNTPISLVVWLRITRPGWLGVDVFFALSGFLITTTLLRTRGKEHFYRNFYMRRVLRLTLPYLIVLMLVGILVPQSGRFLLFSLLYLSNVTVLFGVPLVYGPFWTLAVEEHFYLIWPWLVRFLERRALLTTAFAICLITPVARYIAEGHSSSYSPYFSWFRFDGILWGAILALLAASPVMTAYVMRRWSWIFALASLLGFIAVLISAHHAHDSIAESTFLFSIAALFTTSLIGFFLLGRVPVLSALFRTPVLRFFGDISYWMYLFHMLVILAVIPRLPVGNHGWLAYGVLVIVVLAASATTGGLVRRFVELPMLRLKSRFR